MMLIALSHKQGGKSLTPEGYAPLTLLFLWFYLTVTSSKDRKTLRPSQVPKYYYSTVQQQVK